MRKTSLLSILFVVVLLAVAVIAEAEQSKKVARICFLGASNASTEAIYVKPFRERLRELGYIEGRNIVVECRAAPGKWEQLPELAAEPVRLNLDVLVTEGTPASLAAKQATRLVPVIMVYVGDPVASGLVSSLGRPGGNVTGVSMDANEIVRKDIELLKEIAPGISRVAVWMDSTNPSHLPAFAAMEATADRLKVLAGLLALLAASALGRGSPPSASEADRAAARRGVEARLRA